MIMNMFPNKLPSKIKQYAQTLEIFSTGESTKMHVEFCWLVPVSFPIKGMMVLFLKDMICCFAFQKRTVGARAFKVQRQVSTTDHECILLHNLFNWKWILIPPAQCHQSKISFKSHWNYVFALSFISNKGRLNPCKDSFCLQTRSKVP